MKGLTVDISVLCEDKKTAELVEKEYPQVHIYKNVFPYVFRYGDEEQLRRMLKEDEILVRTPDGLGFLLENGYSGRIITDGEIYTFNKRSKQELALNGIYMDTVPPELNFHEIEERGTKESELLIYGHIPMMISAQCLYKNTQGACRKDAERGHRVSLRDRKGKKLHCICFCKNCVNVIYNSVPLSLHAQKDRIKEMGFKSLRLHFTIEDTDEALRITGYFLRLFENDCCDEDPPFRDYTTGHFNKGVE